jgi:hypothetical protein
VALGPREQLATHAAFAAKAARPDIRREVTARELALLAGGACLLAVVMHWPLVLHLGETIPKDIGDPLPQSWQVAWGGHALAHQPLEFFQSNQFWPLDDTLAFSDALVGYAPAGLIGSGPEAAVVRYDLLFLFAYALAFAGAYLLARELGIGPAGAAVAGAAFAFAPFRLEQDGHLHVISSGGIPLSLAAAVRGYRLRRSGWVLAAFAIAAWQFSLGPTLGLPFTYLLWLLGLAAVVIWLRRGRPPLDRRLLIATVAGAILYVAVAAIIARPYLRVSEDQPDADRSPSTIQAYSDWPHTFAVAPDENLIWGGATSPIRDGLQNPQEKTLFPGLVILGLAAAGVGWRGLDRRLRIGLGLGVVGVCVLALGFREQGGLLWPYRVAYEVLPGWDGMRTPGRLVTFASLGLALLAAGGAERLAAALRQRPSARALGAGAVAALLAAAIVVEGRGLPFDPTGSQAQPEVPRAPIEFSSIHAPQLHLPALRADDNRRYLLWSTDGLRDLVNGRSSVRPVFTASLILAMDGFPDRTSVSALRHTGVRTVTLHLDRVENTPQSDAASKPIAGLGLTRTRIGDVIVYEVRSPNASGPRTPVAGSVSPRGAR